MNTVRSIRILEIRLIKIVLLGQFWSPHFDRFQNSPFQQPSINKRYPFVATANDAQATLNTQNNNKLHH